MIPRRSSLRVAETVVLLALLAGLGVAAIQFGWLWRWNQSAYDAYLRGLSRPAPEDVLIVAIDEPSLIALGRWPWSRSVHAQLIEELARSGAKAVALDILLVEPDLNDPGNDFRLGVAFGLLPVALPVVAEQLGPGGQLLERLPMPALAGKARLGHVHVELDEDGVARSVFLAAGLGDPHWETFAAALLLAADGREARVRQGTAASVPHQWVRQDRMLIPFIGPAGTFRTVSYIDVLKGNVHESDIAGRLVLVGATALGLGDDIPTPVSGNDRLMAGVEFNANVLQAIRDGRLIRELSPPWRIGLTLAFGLLPVVLFGRLRPSHALALALGTSAAIAGLAWLLLSFTWLWFPPVESLLLVAIGYPIWSWRRLESAMSYLRNELDRISADRAASPVPSTPPLAGAIEFASALAPGAQWMLTPSRRPRDRGQPLGRWDYEGEWMRVRLRDAEGSAWVTLVPSPEDDSAKAEAKTPVDGPLREVPSHDAASEPELVYALQQALSETYSTRRELEGGELANLEARISELEVANAETRKLRAMVDRSLAVMPDGVVIMDVAGRVVMANPTSARYLFGDPEMQLIGRPVLDILRSLPGHDWPAVVSAGLTAARPVQVEVAAPGTGQELLVQFSRLAAKRTLDDSSAGTGTSPGAVPGAGSGAISGSTPGPIPISIPVPDASNPNPDSASPAMMVINISDIQMLKDNERRRAELVGFLSHDLRSPIVSLLALSELSQGQQDLDELRALFLRAKGYAERSLAMLEQFLGLTRAESPDGFRPREVDLIQIALNAFENVWAQAQSRGISLSLDYDVDDAWVLGDADLLERVVVNLLDNALKFTPGGKGVTLQVAPDGEHWQISVRDEGPGIPEEEQALLFDRFSRGAGRRGTTGVGLGLAFVKAVVERHGATVTLDSKLGAGSAFGVRLPKLDMSADGPE